MSISTGLLAGSLTVEDIAGTFDAYSDGQLSLSFAAAIDEIRQTLAVSNAAQTYLTIVQGPGYAVLGRITAYHDISRLSGVSSQIPHPLAHSHLVPETPILNKSRHIMMIHMSSRGFGCVWQWSGVVVVASPGVEFLSGKAQLIQSI